MKKFISILLAVMLVSSLALSAAAEYNVWPIEIEGLDVPVIAKTSDEALAEYAAEAGETPTTYKYLIQVPDGKHGMRGADGVTVAGSWFNEYSKGAGVYWWGSAPAACEAWAGYQALVEDEKQHIFYSNVPVEATTIIFNNGIDGTQDPDWPLFTMAAQTINIPSEYPDPEEYATMPEGADSFDNCIWIIDPDQISINEFSGMPTCGGTWYFYYGDGCYGIYAKDSASFTTVEEQCCNPDHFKDGVHVGYQEDEPSTEPPTEEPPLVGLFRGDYDNDKDITIMDATRAQNIIAELIERPDEDFLKVIDADGDGELTIMDATRVQNVVAELCNMDGSKPFVPAV